MSDSVDAGKPAEPQALLEASLESVREVLQELRFGSVLLTIHEGRVVQIDVTEKRRLKAS